MIPGYDGLLLSDLDGLALAASAALDALGDGAALVEVRDPALVVGLAVGARHHGGLGGLVARDGRDELGLAHLLGGPGPLGLREERLDPRLVNEVEGAREDGREDEVEEDTVADMLA